MITQLDFFNDKVCVYCKKDAGRNPNNKNLWNGFYDQDTKDLVCWPCRKRHFLHKRATKFGFQYSEIPVIYSEYNYV
jgi:hypothetical protein